jgi:enolase
MEKIKGIKARQVLDSRGNPTIEVEVATENSLNRAIVPSGASTGVHEALELRDNKKDFNGKSVFKAVNNVNKLIAKKLIGMNSEKQQEIDNLMIKLDGTANKKRLGANAILGVSMAVARAGAFSKKMHLFEHFADIAENKKLKLPIPYANIINGGIHAGNNLDIQEFMIVPYKSRKFSESVKIISETYHYLKEQIALKYGKLGTNVGDEGGFAPPLNTAEEALDLLTDSLQNCGYKSKLRIAMDCAASEYYNDGKYMSQMNGDQMTDYYLRLIKDYKIISIEDPFDQDDFSSYQNFMKKVKIQVVGDDLLVSNKERVEMAINKKLCNALLLKVNQIGTVTEAIEAANLALKNKWNVMVSHRSGETEDPFIADLSVGLGNGQIKLGAPCRSDRTAKYNQLLRIEELL